MFFFVRVLIIYSIYTISLSIPAFAATTFSGPISQDTTWSFDESPYIVDGNVTVEEGVTLTIEPGVRVEFNAGLGMQIIGQLLARGDAQNPILFTSASDSPAPGDWGAIKFTELTISAEFDNTGEYLSGSIIEHAVLEYGKNAVYANKAAPYISNVTFQNNHRALMCSDTPITIDKSFFYNNSASDGGAIYAYASNNPSFPLTITGSTFNGNSSQNGGAVYSSYSSMTIDDCYFTENRATDHGGSISSYYKDYSIHSDTSYYLTITNSTFNGNSAREGGAINFDSFLYSVEDPNDFFPYPMPISPYDMKHYLTITSSTFTENSAITYGGAINSYSLEISDVFLINNSACYGGAIYSSNTDMHNCLIYKNFGETAIYPNRGFITKSTIANNSGSGLWISPSLKITESNIFGNQVYNIRNLTANNITVTNNYWGTTDEASISKKIFDKSDNESLGEVFYLPFLTDFSSSAPIPPNDIDTDNDGIIDDIDNCPVTPNFDQLDTDEDGIGDVCDNIDIDNDNDGYSIDQGDCDDSDASVYPGGSEICEDGIDQDCDGKDENCDTSDNDELSGSDDGDDTCFISIMR